MKISLDSLKANSLLAREALLHQRQLLLLAIEGLIQLVGLNGLWPKNIAGVCRPFVKSVSGVTIKDRPAKCDVLGRVAVATDRHVAAREDKLKMFAPWLTEDGDAVLLTKPTGVVVELLVDLRMPFGLVETLEYGTNEGPLIGGIKVIVDVVVGDVPVVGDAGTQESSLLVLMIPGESRLFPVGREVSAS